MKTFRITLIALLGFALAGCERTVEQKGNVDSSSVRVGVYDSRAIAVAAVGSEYYTEHIKPLEDAFNKAKADGNEELVKELEPKVWARRKQTHRQGFGTAPVDEILAYIKDDLPEIARKAGIGPMVSKWDEEALAMYASAEQVDITMQLVEAFEPKERSLEWAIEIQKKPPMPKDELEAHLAKEGP